MTDVERAEVALVTEGLRRVHGLDLELYSRPLVLLALRELRRRRGEQTFSALLEPLLHQPQVLEELRSLLTVRRPGFLEDAELWRTLITAVFPRLRTYPSLRLWHVECGDGAETYALAALLAQAGLLGKSRIYATDPNEGALARAASGMVDLPLAEAEERYRRLGGSGGLSPLFEPHGERLKATPMVRDAIAFMHHHLEVDGSLNEFQLILCRDVLLRFDARVVGRLHATLFQSLSRFGFLVLGPREGLRGSAHAGAFEPLDQPGRWFRRAA